MKLEQIWLKNYLKVQVRLSHILINKPGNDSTLELRNVTEVEVIGIIFTLSSSKAAGHDRISPKLLKDMAGVITSSLTQIFNQLLLTGVFPDDFNSQ
jgi:hypothetical protein